MGFCTNKYIKIGKFSFLKNSRGQGSPRRFLFPREGTGTKISAPRKRDGSKNFAPVETGGPIFRYHHNTSCKKKLWISSYKREKFPFSVTNFSSLYASLTNKAGNVSWTVRRSINILRASRGADFSTGNFLLDFWICDFCCIQKTVDLRLLSNLAP